MTFPTHEIHVALRAHPLLRVDWHNFSPGEQLRRVEEYAAAAPFPVVVAEAGRSLEGRPIPSMRFGDGGVPILAWARQHGDEPDCTAGLHLALDFLARSGHPVAREILAGVDLLLLPMVNPDGVVHWTRENAAGIDLNRDAVAGAMPEARALLAARAAHKPPVVFNLHDMWAGKTTEAGDLVAIAFQACPFEPADTDDPPRLRAKAICSAMAAAVHDVRPQCTARYTADFMPTAFGDNMARWGMSSVLIEAGGWTPAGGGDDFVRALFALSFLRGLHAVATGEDLTGDPAPYETLPYDSGRRHFTLLVRNGRLRWSPDAQPVDADLAFNTRGRDGRLVLARVGDLSPERGLTEIDAAGLVLTPADPSIPLRIDEERAFAARDAQGNPILGIDPTGVYK